MSQERIEGQESQPASKGRRARARNLAILRGVVALHALGVLTQAIYAGQFLSGIEQAVVAHEAIGLMILAVSLLQVIFAILVTRMRNDSLWFVTTTVVVLLAEALQVGTGFGRFLAVHIPLGVIIFGVVVWQLDYVFRNGEALAGELSA